MVLNVWREQQPVLSLQGSGKSCGILLDVYMDLERWVGSVQTVGRLGRSIFSKPLASTICNCLCHPSSCSDHNLGIVCLSSFIMGWLFNSCLVALSSPICLFTLLLPWHFRCVMLWKFINLGSALLLFTACLRGCWGGVNRVEHWDTYIARCFGKREPSLKHKS